MTLGRSFLLWLLGVLVVTLVLVSALVLWHERRILEDELATRADLLAQILAIAAADGSSPQYLTIFSMAFRSTSGDSLLYSSRVSPWGSKITT